MQLYDIANDPAEERDLSKKNPDVVLELAEHLDRWGRRGGAMATAREVDSDTRSRLEALGYVDQSIAPESIEAK